MLKIVTSKFILKVAGTKWLSGLSDMYVAYMITSVQGILFRVCFQSSSSKELPFPTLAIKLE